MRDERLVKRLVRLHLPWSGRGTVLSLLLMLWVGSVAARAAPGQPRHRLFSQGRHFFLEDLSTHEVRPFEMWNTRMANALLDDRFLGRVIAALDDYQRYGVNTIGVSVQGGELGPGGNHLYPTAFNTDGSLRLTSPVFPRLRRLLAAADRRGMVVIVMIWYHRRHLEVPTDAAALAATGAFTDWLRSTGHRNVLLDTVNEYQHPAFVLPGTTVKRPLFHTLDGALALIRASKQVDPSLMVGISPLGGLLYPAGFLAEPTRERWVEADVIFGHGFAVDPLNRNAYRLRVSPSNPLTRPYINNEFFPQLGSERSAQRDPRTGRLSYGHWDATTVKGYLAEIVKLRAFGGSPNVFSHHQQYLAPKGDPPVAEVGPAGTQPESSPGAGEPSMHWLFRAIAGFRRFGALPLRLDFDDGHGSGLRHDLAGTWRFERSRIVQSDRTAKQAFARIAADGGDFELTFRAGFEGAPTTLGRLGVQVGSALPTGRGLRLLIGVDVITLEDAGGSATPRTLKLAKGRADLYTLRRIGGRASVLVNGVEHATLSPVAAALDPNLLLLTREAGAWFDQVRFTPMRRTDFEDLTTGPWSAIDPTAWAIVSTAGSPTNRVWEADVPAGKTRRAVYDRVFGDFMLGARLDLSRTGRVELRFRAPEVGSASGAGYALTLQTSGRMDLTRVPTSGPAVPLGSAKVRFTPSAVKLTVTAEGARILVAVDDTVAIDVVDGPAGPRAGRLQWIAEAGQTRFDDLCIEAGPDRLPAVAVKPPVVGKLLAGTAFEYRDPDGRGDLADLRLLVTVGHDPPLDLTLLLHPIFGWFALAETEDGEGYRFTLRGTVSAGAAPWTVSLTATDRRGRSTSAAYRVN